MATSLEIPKFANDTEEADWWYDNRHLVEEDFLKAAAEGRLGRGTAMRRALAAQSAVQLDREDAARAQAAANRRGMPYQDYLKMLIHEALEKESNTA
jgi:predicted DNA binding CopG/RHH family protein